jgi:hypothetical protein
MEQEVLTIEKDPGWYPNVQVLKTFFFKFIPAAILDLHLEA